MFHGSIVALVTPMHADGSLDWDTFERLLDWHVEQRTKGLVAMGTTGESATLDMDEHLKVIERAVRYIDGRIPVIAGTGANSTSEALELTEGAARAGADAALLVTPYYNKPSQEGLYLHHKYIAERVELPQLLYNVPSRTAVDMSLETTARLAKIPNIIGIKDATGDLARPSKLAALVDSDFLLISGDDASSLAFLRAGGHAVISVTANVAPRAMSEVCELIVAAEVERAQAIDARLQSLHQRLFLEANPIPVKWALAQMGFGTDVLRLPLTSLAEEFHAPLREAMLENNLPFVNAK